ncbi:MAG: Oxidoreductase [Parcubacteria group bacterium GW2011_GWA2_46_10]|nr:MAG: Oxidoreductase [Microgenomates group bacterium GW2011_GWA1_Microgenomates_45_10]KKU19045.1 MAG: Oxidoreductase [Parcubacteria group bacterium GW2011_GWA2_46_10]
MNLTKELKKIVQGEVKSDSRTLDLYSRDASLLEIKPRAVVFPKNKKDIQAVVRFVASHKKEYPDLGITIRSGGTDMSGAAIGESIIIDVTKHLNQIRKVSRGKNGGYAFVEPGVFYRDFEKETLKKGLIIPAFPASREICTVGGMVANNAGGENTLSYGKVEDYVEELKVILEDGEEYTFSSISESELRRKLILKGLEGDIYRKLFRLVKKNKDLLAKAKPKVSKNSAGYYLWNVWDSEKFDVCKLLVGSQGTLGIITDIKLRLIKSGRPSRMLVIFLNDVRLVGKLIPKILKQKPETVECYDDRTLGIALRVLPDLMKRLKGTLISTAFSFIPEVGMLLKNGFKLPKLIILAEFGGSTPEEAKERALKAMGDLKPLGLPMRFTKSAKEADKYHLIRRESFNLLRQRVRGKQTAPFIDDVIVRPEFLPKFWPKLHKILDRKEYGLIYAITGHLGDGNFHIIPLMDLSKQRNREIIPEIADKVYNLVLEFKGSITAEHNDGIVRAPYLKQMFGGKVYKLFEETKRIFDPQNIFNPGKKIGATKKYVFDHMKTGG